MKFPFSPLTIRNLYLPSNIVYAPLAGCSNFPFRKMVRHFHQGLMFCEMVKMEPLVRREEKTLEMLHYSEDMHPIGAQICGSNPHLVKESVRIIEDLGFDWIDLNCGCPVDKVTKDGSGSGLLKNPSLIGEITAEMRKATKLPLSVKIRSGWDDYSINVEDVVTTVENAGADAIFIHGRTREQAYRGPANWDYIKRGFQQRQKLYVFGNGDAFCHDSAHHMMQDTGVDGVLVARGTMGKPWISQEILDSSFSPPPLKQSLLMHLSYVKKYFPEKRSCLEMRKIAIWYLKDFARARKIRHFINTALSIDEIETIIQSCDF